MKDKIIEILRNNADVLHNCDHGIEIFGIDTKSFDLISNLIIDAYGLRCPACGSTNIIIRDLYCGDCDEYNWFV